MHRCMVPFERELYLEVFDQALVSPFDFKDFIEVLKILTK